MVPLLNLHWEQPSRREASTLQKWPSVPRAASPGAGPRRFFGASCSSAVSSGAAHAFRSGSQRFMAQNQRSAAALAQQEGRFQSIVPIETPEGLISEDECIRADMTAERLARLPAAFAELGAAGADQLQLAKFSELVAIEHVHTLGNSPAMCDAGALVLLGDAALGESLGISPKARLMASTTASGEPLEVVSGCVTVTEALLADQSLHAQDIDLFEIHEAFAATVVKTRQELGIDDSRLNVNGGVIALGHPMGATGAIMTGTLIDELHRQQLSKGIVAASGAAGSGSALLLERC